MKLGILYGIGIGPGDPDLITVKGAQLLSGCRHVFVPKARHDAQSTALSIARKHLHPAAVIHEGIFPMSTDQKVLDREWLASAARAAQLLETGENVCFLTLGDALFYSTYIYFVRRLRRLLPHVRIVTIPGVMAFSAAAALTGFPVGEAKQPVSIVPATDNLAEARRALQGQGTVVLMKIGRRLEAILDLLEEYQALDRAVFVSHAGLADEHVETDLRRLRGQGPRTGYLSVILCRPRGNEKEMEQAE